MVEPSALTDLAGFPRTKSVEPVVAVVDGSVAVEEAVVPRTKSVAVASSSLLLDLCRLGMFGEAVCAWETEFARGNVRDEVRPIIPLVIFMNFRHKPQV